MKYIFLKTCLVIGTLFGGGIAVGSDLPDCPSDTNVRWNNCFGNVTGLSGVKYVGEFKDSKFNGQGTLTLLNGGILKEGIWKDGEFQYAQTSIRKIKKSI